MSYAVAPRRRRNFGGVSSSATGAAVGTAVAGPVGTAVGGFIGGLFHSGSERYENGPLLATVWNELGNNTRSLPASQVAAHQAVVASAGADATNRAAWHDVAYVLIPALRNDVYPDGPPRPLTSLEQSIIAKVGGPVITGTGAVPTQGLPGTHSTTLQAGLLGGVNPTTLALAGLGTFVVWALFGRKRR